MSQKLNATPYGDEPFFICLQNDDFESFLELRKDGYRMKKLRSDFLYQIISKGNLDFFRYFFELDKDRFRNNPFLIHLSAKSKNLKIFEYLLSQNVRIDPKIQCESGKYNICELIAVCGFTECIPLMYKQFPDYRYYIQMCLWKLLPFEGNESTFCELIKDFNVSFLKSIIKRKQRASDSDWVLFFDWFSQQPELLNNNQNRSVQLFLIDNCLIDSTCTDNLIVPDNSEQLSRFLYHFLNNDDISMFEHLCEKPKVKTVFRSAYQVHNTDSFKRLLSDCIMKEKYDYLRALLMIDIDVFSVYSDVISTTNGTSSLKSLKSLRVCADFFVNRYWKELNFRHKLFALWVKFGIKFSLFILGQ